MNDQPTRTTFLPADPFSALAVNFGMLLGVSDFELLGSSPRGKLRLHNAWLEGAGVVWGFPVHFVESSRELQVERGFGYDANGRELYLGFTSCLDIDQWFTEQRKEGRLTGNGPFDLFLVATHHACLSRPVPAVAGECEDDDPSVAYSRIEETVELDLVTEIPPPAVRFARLRRVLGLDIDDDRVDANAIAAIDTEIDRIWALPEDERAAAWDALVRRAAADDSIDDEPRDVDPPGIAAFPEAEPCPLVLATVRVTVNADGKPQIADGAIDTSARTVHVPRAILAALATRAALPPDGGGPRLDLATLVKTPSHITIEATAELVETSMGRVTVRTWSGAGWTDSIDGGPEFDAATKKLTLRYSPAPGAGEYVRIVIPGTGPAPVVGTDGLPLAGVVGGPPTPPHQGADVVIIVEGS